MPNSALLDGQSGADDADYGENWAPLDANESIVSAGESPGMVRDVNRRVASPPGCSAGVLTRVPGLHKNTSAGEDTRATTQKG